MATMRAKASYRLWEVSTVHEKENLQFDMRDFHDNMEKTISHIVLRGSFRNKQ